MGAQNFENAVHNGRALVSGIAFGPDCVSLRRASALVRPPGISVGVSAEFVGALLVMASSAVFRWTCGHLPTMPVLTSNTAEAKISPQS